MLEARNEKSIENKHFAVVATVGPNLLTTAAAYINGYSVQSETFALSGPCRYESPRLSKVLVHNSQAEVFSRDWLQ